MERQVTIEEKLGGIHVSDKETCVSIYAPKSQYNDRQVWVAVESYWNTNYEEDHLIEKHFSSKEDALKWAKQRLRML